VPGGSGEQLWLSLLDEVVLPAAESFAPDLVLVSAGFDGHREDPLAGCMLETGSFSQMAARARELARRCDAPLGAVLEGGYAPAPLAASVLATLTALAGEQPVRSPSSETPALTARALAQIGRYWQL
jgi:acetoin utilization deacetylase AcuC-like enzyme